MTELEQSLVEEELHRFDLQQVEVIEKLHHRLGRELALMRRIIQLMAYRESAVDAERLSLMAPTPEPEEGETQHMSHEDALRDLGRQAISALKLMKAGIWQVSEKLRSTHLEQRQVRDGGSVEES